MSLNFRSLTDLHIQSNLIEVFKLKSSQSILLKCWVKICLNKCEAPICGEDAKLINSTIKPKVAIKLMANETDFVYKDVGVQYVVDDPYGGHRANTQYLKNSFQLPHVIELQFKSRPFSGIIKATIISAIAIVFAMIVSIISILVYRSLLRSEMFSMDRTDNTESMCQTSDICKYDMNSRNYGSSYFHNQTEPTNEDGRW